MFKVPMEFPLHYAVEKNDYELIEDLIEQGADINAVDEDYYTPLRKAMESDDIHRWNKEVIKLLIEKGADVNFNGIDGSTPLYRAVIGGCHETAKLLIAHGADINAKIVPYDESILDMVTMDKDYRKKMAAAFGL